LALSDWAWRCAYAHIPVPSSHFHQPHVSHVQLLYVEFLPLALSCALFVRRLLAPFVSLGDVGHLLPPAFDVQFQQRIHADVFQFAYGYENALAEAQTNAGRYLQLPNKNPSAIAHCGQSNIQSSCQREPPSAKKTNKPKIMRSFVRNGNSLCAMRLPQKTSSNMKNT